jgi:SAM-dependent MidA family methyltransferase
MSQHVEELGDFLVTAVDIDEQFVLVLGSYILNLWEINGVSGC